MAISRLGKQMDANIVICLFWIQAMSGLVNVAKVSPRVKAEVGTVPRMPPSMASLKTIDFVGDIGIHLHGQITSELWIPVGRLHPGALASWPWRKRHHCGFGCSRASSSMSMPDGVDVLAASSDSCIHLGV